MARKDGTSGEPRRFLAASMPELIKPHSEAPPELPNVNFAALATRMSWGLAIGFRSRPE